MKAKESISFPMDFETYYSQYCACVRRAVKADREDRLAKTSKGRRFAEQFLLFVGMAALAFFIGKELVDSFGSTHPATWAAVIGMVILILLPFLNEVFGWSRNLRLRNQLEQARQRIAEKNFNGIRVDFFADRAEIYAQKLQGEKGELLRSAPISPYIRVEHNEDNLLCFFTRASKDVFVVDLSRVDPDQASHLLDYVKQRFYFREEETSQNSSASV